MNSLEDILDTFNRRNVQAKLKKARKPTKPKEPIRELAEVRSEKTTQFQELLHKFFGDLPIKIFFQGYSDLAQGIYKNCKISLLGGYSCEEGYRAYMFIGDALVPCGDDIYLKVTSKIDLLSSTQPVVLSQDIAKNVEALEGSVYVLHGNRL